jgi:flagellar basal-body rod modification protein FlgD
MSLAILNVPAQRINTIPTPDVPKTSTKADATTAAPAQPGMLDRDAFLKLLVAQLRYQDPSKPMDASQMVSQSAQLTMVDKLDSISTMLEASALTGRLGLAGSLIGKEITFAGADGITVKDVVTSVRFADDGTLILHTGDWDVPMASVLAIGAPTAVPGTTPVTAPATTNPVVNPAAPASDGVPT